MYIGTCIYTERTVYSHLGLNDTFKCDDVQVIAINFEEYEWRQLNDYGIVPGVHITVLYSTFALSTNEQRPTLYDCS